MAETEQNSELIAASGSLPTCARDHNRPTPEIFLNDVAGHQMTINLRDGIYRHIRFQNPSHGWCMGFDIVTWPGSLTISGDMGTWTFSRVPDMFNFFRSGVPLRINESYWAEKLQHGVHGGSDGAKVYDDEEFERRLLKQLSNYFTFDGADLEEVTRAVRDDVLRVDGRYDRLRAAADFEFRFADGRKDSEHYNCHDRRGEGYFSFDACELPSGMRYSYQFVWCLYAIVWAIRKWDFGAESLAQGAGQSAAEGKD